MKNKDFKELLKSIDQARAINKTIKEHRAKVRIQKKSAVSTGYFGNKEDDSIYYHIYKDKSGKMVCFDGDTVK